MSSDTWLIKQLKHLHVSAGKQTKMIKLSNIPTARWGLMSSVLTSHLFIGPKHVHTLSGTDTGRT